jgi:hypothetical protein
MPYELSLKKMYNDKVQSVSHRPQMIYQWWTYYLMQRAGWIDQSPYVGQLYQPFREHEWAKFYELHGDEGTRWDRYQRRLVELPSSSLWHMVGWSDAISHWQYACAACGCGSGSQMAGSYFKRDHLVPVSHAQCPGSVVSNLLVLCDSCNRAKSNDDFMHWYSLFHTLSECKRTLALIWSWQFKCWQKGWR